MEANGFWQMLDLFDLEQSQKLVTHASIALRGAKHSVHRGLKRAMLHLVHAIDELYKRLGLHACHLQIITHDEVREFATVELDCVHVVRGAKILENSVGHLD